MCDEDRQLFYAIAELLMYTAWFGLVGTGYHMEIIYSNTNTIKVWKIIYSRFLKTIFEKDVCAFVAQQLRTIVKCLQFTNKLKYFAIR